MVRKLGGDEDARNLQSKLRLKYHQETVRHGQLDWKALNAEIAILSKISGGFDKRATQYGTFLANTEDIVRLTLRIQSRLEGWIDGYVINYGGSDKAFPIFQEIWKMCRAWVPFQLRLAAEQVFYNKGEPWRKLVSGFKPL